MLLAEFQSIIILIAGAMGDIFTTLDSTDMVGSITLLDGILAMIIVDEGLDFLIMLRED